MSKNTPFTDRWRISEMASHLPKELIGEVDPAGDGGMNPSTDRIKQLALQKREEYLNRNEERPMKKSMFRILLAAAVVCALSVTAFAAFGGLDYIKGIFGESAESVQNEIATPQVSASAGGRELALEALLTDGYVTNMVLSLTGNQPPEEQLFELKADIDLRTNGWYRLEQFSQPGKNYYVVDFVSEKQFEKTKVTLSLNQNVAPIALPIQVENKLGNAVITFPEKAMSGNTHLKELQVSPMGFLLIGREDDAKGGLPATYIQLLYTDGKTEEIEVEFDAGEGDISGGGGAIMVGPNEPKPLVTAFQGVRNPNGDLVINGQFSRIINPAKIKEIIIDEVVYKVK